MAIKHDIPAVGPVDSEASTESGNEEEDALSTEEAESGSPVPEKDSVESCSIISPIGEHDKNNVATIPYVGVGGIEVTDRALTSACTHICRIECYGPKALSSDPPDGDEVGSKSVISETMGENVHGHPKSELGAYCSARALFPDVLGRWYILPVLSEATLETLDDNDSETREEDTKTDAPCLLGVGG